MAGGERPPSVLNIAEGFMGFVMSMDSKNESISTKNSVNVKLGLVPGSGLIQGELSRDDSITGNLECGVNRFLLSDFLSASFTQGIAHSHRPLRSPEIPSLTMMADLANCATPGLSWTTNELATFNIKISLRKVDDFFGRPRLPEPLLSEIILTSSNSQPGMSKAETKFFSLMEDALPNPTGQQIFVVDFMVHLLGLMDYDVESNIIHRHEKMDLLVSRSPVTMETDVAVMRRFSSHLFYLMLVYEDQVCILLEAFEQP
jgi:hypothetical protein